MVCCNDGAGGFIGMDVTVDAFCRNTEDAGNQVAETQALIRKTTDPKTVTTVLKVTTFGPWTVSQAVIELPNVELEVGALMTKGYACHRNHDAWTAGIQFDGDYDLMLLVGAKGKIRRTVSDGSYREAEGRVISATVFPNQAEGELSVGEIAIQWNGGNYADPGFPKFTAAP